MVVGPQMNSFLVAQNAMQSFNNGLKQKRKGRKGKGKKTQSCYGYGRGRDGPCVALAKGEACLVEEVRDFVAIIIEIETPTQVESVAIEVFEEIVRSVNGYGEFLWASAIIL